ncbi:MAG: response regulator, partial [Clostridiales bacterium]|nr:response regulator [Clostridiales bacterium]
QPCGRASKELTREKVTKAFKTGYERFEWMHKTQDNKPLPCEITLIRIEYEGEYHIAAYKRDLREEKAAKKKIAEAEVAHTATLANQNLRLNLLLGGIDVATWDMPVYPDVPVTGSSVIWYSDEFRRMLGFTDENDFPNILESWSGLLHPDEKEKVFTDFISHMNDYTGQTPYDIEHRIMMKNGEYKWFRCFGNTLRNDDGIPLRVAGATEDINERKLLEEALFRREMILDALNQMSITLLSHENKSFDEVMNTALRKIVTVMGFNRVAAYRRLDNETNRLGQVYLWDGETIPLENHMQVLPDIPPVRRWVDLLVKGECINADISQMPKDEADFLKMFNIKAVYMVPIFTHEEFWGVITLEDQEKYRYFDEKDFDVLKSAAHLCAGAIVQNEIIREADERNDFIRIMFDNAPVGLTLFDENFNFIDCNEAVLRMYGVSKTFYKSFFGSDAHMPEYQPDGSKSHEKAHENTKRLIAGEMQKIEWVHLMPDGSPLPVELTMSRVKQGDKFIGLGYIYDMRKQKEMERHLVEAMKAAQEATRAKSEFLSGMSHEMRTPMNASIGMTGIGKKATDIEQKNHALNKIGDASSHLLGVINDVLDISKIEAGKLELVTVQYIFEHMIQRVVAVIGFRADEKRQSFAVNVDSRIPRFIEGDDQRLAQVITNLLSNAVKFTPDEGEVSMNVSLIGETDGVCELRFVVADNGIGISPQQQIKLFNAFVQAESGTNRQFGGTGLGLVISKNIIEMMGGKIWIESELGKGAKFIFTVKARCVDDEALSAANADNGSEIIAGEFNGKTMLLAEDIEINREILISLLEDTGIIIDCAENGKDALDIIAAGGMYDVVLMDVQMPEMGGLEATRRIRALHGHQREKLPIIAMTANVFKDDIAACEAAGMDSHVGKPLDMDKVLKILRIYL